jgi:hypothetical protein
MIKPRTRKLVCAALLLIVGLTCHGLVFKSANADPACTVTAGSLAAIASDAAAAAPGATVCVSGGTYDGELVLSAHPASNITIEPVPGDTVTFTNSDHNVGIAVDFGAGASNITFYNFYLTSEIFIEAGASNLTIDHNDISGGYFGISGGGVNCSAPNAPVSPGCNSEPTINNITISGNKLHGFGYDPTNSSGINWPVDNQVPAPEPNSEDALHFNNFEHLHITANEITGAEEGGNHTDCLQIIWGGDDLTFDHNYEHDNQCQGFFVKDGDVSNISVTDNLFVRDYAESFDQSDLQIYNASPVTIRNNTFWDSQGNVIRAENSSFSPSTAAVNHNVFMLFNVLTDSGTSYQMTEDYDIFKNDPFTFLAGSHSATVSSPAFADTAADNYQLASNPSSIGVDWYPAQYVYGPVPTSPSPTPPASTPSSETPAASSSSAMTTPAAKKTKTTAAAKLLPASASGPATSSESKLQISNVRVTKVGQHTATVTWQTNEPASSLVKYGLDNNLNLNASAPGNTTSHSVTLDPAFLKPGLYYSVQVSGTDAQGRQVTGSEISFHTSGVSLTLVFTDPKGRPLRGVRVTLAGQTRFSDNRGRATFSDAPYGNRTVTASYGNQKVSSQANIGVQTSGGRYIPQTFNLRLAAKHSKPPVYLTASIAAVVVILAAALYIKPRGGFQKQLPPLRE